MSSAENYLVGFVKSSDHQSRSGRAGALRHAGGVAIGGVEIHRGLFQGGVAHQKLDSPQVRSGFHQGRYSRGWWQAGSD